MEIRKPQSMRKPKFLHVSLFEMKNAADSSAIVPIMKKGKSEKSELIANTSTMIPFNNKTAISVPNPKFRGVFFAPKKDNPANRLSNP